MLTFFFLHWTVIQGVYSRTPALAQVFSPVLTVQDVARQLKPTGLWLNIQVTVKLQVVYHIKVVPHMKLILK